MKKETIYSSFYKIVGLAIALSFFAPDTAKFIHIFSHDNHMVCEGGNTVHFHTIDIDCDFYKFKVHNQFIFTPETFEPLVHQFYAPYFNNYKSSFYKVTLKLKSLRAPPVFA